MRSIKIDLKWAQTLDGQLCDDTGSSKWISGAEERILTHSIRAKYDAIVVGASTYINDNAQLTVREGFEKDLILQPARIIIDPRGVLAMHFKNGFQDEKSKLILEDLESGPRDTYIVGKTEGIMGKLYQRLRVIEADLEFNSPHFKENFLQALQKIPSHLQKNSLRLLVEGGPRLLKQLISHDLYDELSVSIAPRLTGGKQHRIELMKNLSNTTQMKTIHRSFVGEDTFMVMKRNEEKICTL